MKIIKSFALVLMLVAAGCKRESANLAGNYIGHYANATEYLSLNTNGILTQVLSNSTGVIYTNNGTWKLEKDGLYFYDYIQAVDLEKGQLVTDVNKFVLHPHKYSLGEVDFDDSGVLTTAPDTLYYFVRASDLNNSESKQ